MDIREQAIGLAMSDMGLTRFEAENSFDDYFPKDDNNYCDDCGTVLEDNGDNANCKNMFLDDYCLKCWNAFNEKFGV